MKVERTDKIDKTIYIMTETHRYRDILSRLKETEPATIPIKHVGTINSTLMATGYKIPAATAKIDEILTILKETPA